ncbi:Integrase catalytic domain-containing protein [Citrus sinensis]|uniref:Integrase catalytic domain-containing protein n=1 Tax=Citrus sinensis TaxID=2711 RepID=A0ACB8NT35_CITSI|nr:Integrase catalytic domain-containing protein [Citrus sinensis]
MASTRVDLEKFNGDNDFYLWSLNMTAILNQQGLNSALDDEEDPMAKKEKGEGSLSFGGDQMTINNKAHSTIILYLSDEVLREVSKERTASGLWAKLKEMFLKKSLTKRLYMKRRLYTFSMKDGVTMKDHVDEFNKLILDLENVNIILEDEDRALILLSSLPESYEHFVDTLFYGKQTFTLKDVKNALESKDLKKRAEDYFEKKKLEELQKKSNGKADVAFEDEGDYDEANVLVAAERHPTGMVDQSGCTIKAENGEIHVTDKGETVIKGVRKNGLYILVGSSPEHGVSVSVTRDKTKLWHMRLAHISERGLRELSNQGLFVTTATYLINRSPSTALRFKTPQEIWSGKPPDLSNLRIFGCPAYAHIKQIADEVNGGEPLSYKEAMCCGDKLKCLDEEIFMAQPEGFIERGSEDKVYLLKKSLYGLKQSPMQCAVGSIMYAMVCTRPDLAHRVGVISRFMGNPGKDHWNAVKWVLRYLRGTVVTAIVFGKISGASPEVVGFVDSDSATDNDRRRSITGFVFTMCGGAISWKSSLQSAVALSTTEAEYIALTEAIKEAIWLRGLVSELGFKQEVVKVSCDSSSDIQLSKNPKYHERTKHIDIRMHFIRDEIGKGVVSVVKVPSEVNPADMLTKPLPSVRFRNLLNLIGSVNL